MSEKNCWFVRLGSNSQYEADALGDNLVCIDFGMGNFFEEMKGREFKGIRKIVERERPEFNAYQIGKVAGQINKFMNDMKNGDIIVCPVKMMGSGIQIGEIKGGCEPKKTGDEEQLFSRKVDWINDEPISRDNFDDDILNSFTAHATVFGLNKEDVVERIEKIATGGKAPSTRQVTDLESQDGETPELRLEELAWNEIEKRITRNFGGTKFEGLVSEILKAKGYEVYYDSSKGPDGGVDVVAGGGEFGFDDPKIVVQVKSGGQGTFNSEDVFYGLTKAIERCGADYGLFVSWQGFARDIHIPKKIKGEFFKIRLWDKEKIMSELFSVYHNLPQHIKAKLPLKQFWSIDYSFDESI